MVGGLGPADYGLDEVGRMAAGAEGGFGYVGKVLGAPCCVLGSFEDERGAGEEGRDQGGDEVVEGVARDGVSVCMGGLIGREACFQLTQAATMPNGSHRTSLCLYIIRKLVGLLSGRSAFSPCFMVHCSFSTVTNVSPSMASTFVFPESRHATVAMVS